jgi:hypothetical protein
MKRLSLIASLSILSLFNPILAISHHNSPINLEDRMPQDENSVVNLDTNHPGEFQEMESFAAAPFKLNAATGQVPVQTRLRLIVTKPLSAKTSNHGDDFEARVVEDFYVQGNNNLRRLIVPKNSWIKGKVTELKRPRLFSRSGKLGVKLDTLLTAQGEYVPLDAELSFQEGVVNEQGLLDPQTNYGDKAIRPTKKLLKTDTGKIISVATLGVPVAGTLLGGSVIALFSHGDPAVINKGQELQIMVTKNMDVAL